jgi:hypothetical protein
MLPLFVAAFFVEQAAADRATLTSRIIASTSFPIERNSIPPENLSK